MATQSVATANNVNEALARLCNAECMLELVLKAHDASVSGGDDWTVSEALHGVLRLLNGVYSTLMEFAGSSAQDSEVKV